jgi:hypothetical protein
LGPNERNAGDGLDFTIPFSKKGRVGAEIMGGARGLGRRRSLAAAQVYHARALIECGESPRAVVRTMRVGKSTLYRALKATEGRSGPAPPIPTGRLGEEQGTPRCHLQILSRSGRAFTRLVFSRFAPEAERPESTYTGHSSARRPSAGEPHARLISNAPPRTRSSSRTRPHRQLAPGFGGTRPHRNLALQGSRCARIFLSQIAPR